MDRSRALRDGRWMFVAGESRIGVSNIVDDLCPLTYSYPRRLTLLDSFQIPGDSPYSYS